ncbi:MAG: hypothetical protein QOE36_3009, partial [Gaiellaceae bacterium]|nr:hypothetical protein [Gaiellaceae bacterium]
RERRLLAPEPLVEEPRLRVRRLAARAVALFVSTSLAFMVLESTLHWRAGLGWHGLQCLVGPTHRNAIPILGALSLVAAALAAALEHVVAWMRRTVAQLAEPARRLPHAPSPAPACVPILRAAFASAGPGARAPPVPAA